MKYIFLIIFLLASLFLTSCEQQNDENLDENSNISINNEQYKNMPSDENTERISYKDYVEKYDEPTNESQNNNKEPNNVLDDDNTAITPSNQLATYSTPLLSSSNERINNIEIVCDRLNNFILEPNQTFSYNDIAGPFGPDDGFEEATILLSDGSKTKGYGGGVCQLSSTLYNVVMDMENIEIIERHEHSAPVAYVPEGRDATVSLQSGLDFKFINNNNYPIRFEAKCNNDMITVNAFREA